MGKRSVSPFRVQHSSIFVDPVRRCARNRHAKVRKAIRMEAKSMDTMSEKPAARSVGLALVAPRTALEAPPHPFRGDRSQFLRRRLLAADVAASLLAGLLAGWLAGASGVALAAMALSTALLWPFIAFSVGLHFVRDLSAWASGIPDASKLAMGALALSWPAYGLAAVLDVPHPAVAAVAATLGCSAGASAGRAVVRMVARRARTLSQSTLIVGSGVVADELLERLARHSELALHPVGFIDDEVHGDGVGDLPRLGELKDLPSLLALGGIQRVMIAFSRAGHEELLACIRACRDAQVSVDVVPRLFEFLDGARTLDQIGGMPLLSISAPSLSRAAHAAKRTLDVVMAGASLLALAPLIAVIVAAIKLESRGPILFRQARVGRHGKVFRIYKFRSMYVGADERKHDVAGINDLADGVMFKIYTDPRVTRVGRLLRRFSLDELPQLLNVLRGEMSLVGPRPLIIPEATALTHEWQGRRVDLRPGLTGPWQVSGRSHVPFDEMVRFDYQYVVGWSLARDIQILLATIPAVLSGRGAY